MIFHLLYSGFIEVKFLPGVFLNCPSRASRLGFTVDGEFVLDDLWEEGPRLL